MKTKSNGNGFKRLSLRVPLKTWKAAKIRLVEKGTTFQAFLLKKLKEIAEGD